MGKDYWSCLWSPRNASCSNASTEIVSSEFIRCPTPNPPGDTRIAARHVQKLLDTHGVAYLVTRRFPAGKPGRHLTLNGPIDVFPVGPTEGWTHAGRELVDDKIYDRDACDRKAGTTASLFTFLREMREALRGQMTLSIVSDEEAFGPGGARSSSSIIRRSSATAASTPTRVGRLLWGERQALAQVPCLHGGRAPRLHAHEPKR
jgi:hypothetical protein